MRKTLSTALLAATLAIAGGGTAMAATFSTISTTGASLSSGNYSWGPGLGRQAASPTAET